jgi:phage tail sheath gpL-like
MDLNIFNKVKIPFTIEKSYTKAQILNSLKASIDEYVEVPFTAVYNTETSLLSLTSKWKGETSKFEIDFVNSDDEVITRA